MNLEELKALAINESRNVTAAFHDFVILLKYSRRYRNGRPYDRVDAQVSRPGGEFRRINWQQLEEVVASPKPAAALGLAWRRARKLGRLQRTAASSKSIARALAQLIEHRILLEFFVHTKIWIICWIYVSKLFNKFFCFHCVLLIYLSLCWLW